MTDDTGRDPLARLSAEGVAVWLDDLSRELLAGVDFDDVTSQLERDGVAKFDTSWSELSASVTASASSSGGEGAVLVLELGHGGQARADGELFAGRGRVPKLCHQP